MAASSKSAFSLVELLVAVAVAAVVGGTALALILQAFDVWERGLAQTGELRAADAFDLDFARDFASACPALGFQGSADGCVFWTLLPDGGEGALARVRYAFDADGAVAERWSFGEDLEAPGRATRYRTRAFSSFAYGGTNVADDAWLPLWDSPTNMPRAVTLGRVAPPAPPMRRLYLRRTAP